MAITTIIKRLLGVEDVNWDSDGSDSRFPVENSTGGTRSVKRVNSSDIPSTTAAREKKRIGSSTPTTGGKDVDGHLQEVYDDLNKIGDPDAATLQNSDGSLKVKAGGIGPDQIANDAVVTDKILNINVTTEKIALLAVETNQLGNDAVTSGKILNGAVGEDKLATDAVVTVKIKDEEVTGAKLLLDAGTIKQPQFFCVAAGEITLAGGDAEQTFSVTNMLTTDIVMCNYKVNSDDTSQIQYAGSDTVHGRFLIKSSGTQGAAETVQYMIFRAVST